MPRERLQNDEENELAANNAATDLYRRLYGQELTNSEVEDIRRNLVGVFKLLIKIEQRLERVTEREQLKASREREERPND